MLTAQLVYRPLPQHSVSSEALGAVKLRRGVLPFVDAGRGQSAGTRL